MRTVSVFMDVEDPINLIADDAALDLATLFTQIGIRGSFCLTGEKCRKLVARRRHDVLEALRPHCLGLHTDTHSYHPTTMELLEDVSYEEGCRLAYETEKAGYDAFVAAFGRSPSYWGGAGNTWSPEIIDAINGLGIPAFVYAQTELTGQPVLRFNGSFAFPQTLSVSEDDWAKGREAGDRVLTRLAEIDLPWIGIFVGHPTRFRHRHFWDVGFFDGRTPNPPHPAEPVTEKTYEAERTNLRIFLSALLREHRVLGLDEVMNQKWLFRDLTEDEQTDFRERTAHNLRETAKWPVNRRDLDAGNIIRKTLDLTHTVARGDLESTM